GAPMSPMKLGNSGLEKLGWMRRLKNWAGGCKITCSVRAVSLKTEKLNSLKLGPCRELRPRLPKWRVPGTQLVSSDVPSLPWGFPQVQGAANEDKFKNCVGLLVYWSGPITSGRSNPSPAPE